MAWLSSTVSATLRTDIQSTRLSANICRTALRISTIVSASEFMDLGRPPTHRTCLLWKLFMIVDHEAYTP